ISSSLRFNGSASPGTRRQPRIDQKVNRVSGRATMANEHPTLEEKVAQLTAELNDVKVKVEQLYSLLDTATPRLPPAQHHDPAVSRATSPRDEAELPTNMSEEMLTWAGKTSL